MNVLVWSREVGKSSRRGDDEDAPRYFPWGRRGGNLIDEHVVGNELCDGKRRPTSKVHEEDA